MMSEDTAWRCSSCAALQYNIVWEGGRFYPAPGAPPSHFISLKYQNVCWACFDLYQIAFDSGYLRKIQREMEKDRGTFSDATTPPSGWERV